MGRAARRSHGDLHTDNAATKKVVHNLKNSTRAKHALRRYHVLQQRIKEGDVELRWIPDEHNPRADFLTKFCGGSKYEQSKRFATGIHAKEAMAAVKGWRKPRR